MEWLDVMELDVTQARLAASNPDTPTPVLELLAHRSEAFVLERVADNPNASFSTLAQLAKSQAPEVRAAIADNSRARDMLFVLATDISPDVRYRVAENPRTPSGLLKSLANDDNPYVASRAHSTILRRQGAAVRLIDSMNKERNAG
ncbi:MAG: HEAT repeat domain-containing protein [Terriglobales bacterium]